MRVSVYMLHRDDPRLYTQASRGYCTHTVYAYVHTCIVTQSLSQKRRHISESKSHLISGDDVNIGSANGEVGPRCHHVMGRRLLWSRDDLHLGDNFYYYFIANVSSKNYLEKSV